MPGKRDPTCHGVLTRNESYASRVYPNNRDGERPVLVRKGKPMRHEYDPMTVFRLLSFMYKNENENEKVKLLV